jgi:hypothetical protein
MFIITSDNIVDSDKMILVEYVSDKYKPVFDEVEDKNMKNE